MTWWNWLDPEFALAFVGAVGGAAGALAAVVIPLYLVRLARRGEQITTLIREDQRRIARRQRRDDILLQLQTTTDSQVLTALAAEVGEYDGTDRVLLARALRLNPLRPLPTGFRALTDVAVTDFVDSLPARYVSREAFAFAELQSFVGRLSPEQVDRHSGALVRLLTGEAAVVQRPSHLFFAELVSNGGWELAPSLIGAVEEIGHQRGWLALNALTGTLLGIRWLDEPVPGRSLVQPVDRERWRRRIQLALATLLMGRTLEGVRNWEWRRSTEPTSATAAWLVAVLGEGAGLDGHLDMRAMQNLAGAVDALYTLDPLWGMDESSVTAGLRQLRSRQPGLWSRHGAEIVKACRMTESSLADP